MQFPIPLFYVLLLPPLPQSPWQIQIGPSFSDTSSALMQFLPLVRFQGLTCQALEYADI